MQAYFLSAHPGEKLQSADPVESERCLTAE